jgi:hypothetical protein
MFKMKAIMALFCLALLFPTQSHAKIGETKAELEARLGQPVKFSTISSAWFGTWIEPMRAVFNDWDLYKSDFQPAEVRAENSALGYKGVWFGLGKVIGEWYPLATKDETVIRSLEESLGTSDLVENHNKKYVLSDCASYITRDNKYVVYVFTGVGTFVGTRGFIDVILEPAATRLVAAIPKD